MINYNPLKVIRQMICLSMKNNEIKQDETYDWKQPDEM